MQFLFIQSCVPVICFLHLCFFCLSHPHCSVKQLHISVIYNRNTHYSRYAATAFIFKFSKPVVTKADASEVVKSPYAALAKRYSISLYDILSVLLRSLNSNRYVSAMFSRVSDYLNCHTQCRHKNVYGSCQSVDVIVSPRHSRLLLSFCFIIPVFLQISSFNTLVFFVLCIFITRLTGLMQSSDVSYSRLTSSSL